MSQTRPSTGWHPVAFWLALAGVFTAVVMGFVGYQMLHDRLDALSRTPVPGQVTVEVAEPQGLTIYYEDPSAPSGFVVEASGTNTLASTLVDLAVKGPSGESVAAVRFEQDLRFNHDGRIVIALATIDAPTAGSYTVLASGTVPPTALVSVGRVVDFGLVAESVGAIALFVGSVLLLMVTVTVAAIERRRVTSEIPV